MPGWSDFERGENCVSAMWSWYDFVSWCSMYCMPGWSDFEPDEY
jgi:hypothetical protein